MARLQAFWALQPYADRLASPTDVCRYPWEKETKAMPTEKDREALRRRVQQMGDRIDKSGEIIGSVG